MYVKSQMQTFSLHLSPWDFWPIQVLCAFREGADGEGESDATISAPYLPPSPVDSSYENKANTEFLFKTS